MDTSKAAAFPSRQESGKPSFGSTSLGVRWFARAKDPFDQSASPRDLLRAAGAPQVLKPNSGRAPTGVQREIPVRFALSLQPDQAAECTRSRKERLGRIIGEQVLPRKAAALGIQRLFPRRELAAPRTQTSLGVRGTTRSAQDMARGQTREPKGTAGKIHPPVAGEFGRYGHGNSRRHA